MCRDLWIPGPTRRAVLREVGPAARRRRRVLVGRGVTWVAQILLRMPIVLGELRPMPPWRLFGVASALLLAYVASVLGLVYARDYALLPAPTGVDVARAHTLLTHIFFHADWFHLLGNLYFFYMFGRAVEHALGGARFLFVFFSAGVLGGLAQALFAPAASALVLGASGAIAGVMGAHLWLFPKNRVLQVLPFIFIQIEIPAWAYLCLWIFGQIAMAATMYALGLAWFSHIAGFLYGFAAAAFAVRAR